MKRKIFNIIKDTIEFIFNIKAKYFEKETSALDEVIKDYMDYEMAGNIETKFPDSFEYEPREVFNQYVTGYKSSCTAQGTGGASDTIRKYKADKTRTSPFKLRDEVKERKLGKEGQGAYLIDTIKVAKDLGKIDGYYRLLTIDAVKKALYNTDIVVTGSTKIDWKRLQETKYIVDKVSIGSGHAFFIRGWNNKGFIAQNSYGTKYGINGTFIIPYDLFFKLAFKSTYAITVNPEWAKLSREELYNKYSITKK